MDYCEKTKKVSLAKSGTFNLFACAKTRIHKKLERHANAHTFAIAHYPCPLVVTVQLTMHSVRDKWERED